MAVYYLSSSFILTLFLFSGISSSITATTFTLQNHCQYPIWPATLTGDGPPLFDTGIILNPGTSTQLPAPPNWSGRFWARTLCTFDDSGTGHCATGDCGGKLHCNDGVGGTPPVTLAEFTLNGSGGQDFYDVSLVDGYNVGLGITPTAGKSGNCQYAGCVNDLNGSCPPELRVMGGGGDGGMTTVVACMSACAAFNSAEFCCTGEHATPERCGPTQYSDMFKRACPTAYSYAYDDASSTCTCTGSDYLITFCPNGS